MFFFKNDSITILTIDKQSCDAFPLNCLAFNEPTPFAVLITLSLVLESSSPPGTVFLLAAYTLGELFAQL